MTPAVTITFQGMPPSSALKSDIEQHAEKLQRLAPHLQACRVVVQHSEQRHRQGNRYQVHAHLTLPGAVIEAGNTPSGNQSHEDPYLAVRDTFDALRRQLEDRARSGRD
jgi:ribosomal subunit interface protein